jgi:twitching motility protein PilT
MPDNSFPELPKPSFMPDILKDEGVKPPMPAPGMEKLIEGSKPAVPPLGSEPVEPPLEAVQAPETRIATVPEKAYSIVVGAKAVVYGDEKEWEYLYKLSMQKGISDFEFTEGLPLVYYRYGQLCHDSWLVTPDFMEAMCKRMSIKYGEEADRSLFGYSMRFRVHTFRTQKLFSAVWRLMPEKIMSIEDVRLTESLVEGFCSLSTGLVLFCGQTGAGKSSSIAALLLERAKRKRELVITLEDPIEYIFPLEGLPSRFLQREVGDDVIDFPYGLRAALRMAPKVIVVGEIRDKETAEVAVHASETGHVVVSTLHTGDVVESIRRLLVFFADNETGARMVLSNTLKLVVCQALLPRRDVEGRIPLHEILVNYGTAGTAVSNQIARGDWKSLTNYVDTNSSSGQLSFKRCAEAMVKQGLISPDVAKRFNRTPGLI